MNTWKLVCRQIESKQVHRHFDGLMDLADTSALFECSADQRERAAEYAGAGGSDDVPPFPFPRICLMGKDSATLTEMSDTG